MDYFRQVTLLVLYSGCLFTAHLGLNSATFGVSCGILITNILWQPKELPSQTRFIISIISSIIYILVLIFVSNISDFIMNLLTILIIALSDAMSLYLRSRNLLKSD